MIQKHADNIILRLNVLNIIEERIYSNDGNRTFAEISILGLLGLHSRIARVIF